MFQDAIEIRDRLADLVDRLDPDAVSASTARELWAMLDKSERLCAAGKTLLARRLAQTHRPEKAGAKTAVEDLARQVRHVDRGGEGLAGHLGAAAGAARCAGRAATR